ncbi:hypothetical protein ElyMa_003065100 [Elysia marginata]|uniref:Uncharacterized protein n=1 Tax=Elysia marginata TaxID=1093978 RepID=A0AAV4IJJ0_9GAST|nr:hypothetical protein ElyMa_003065100 [Elysia marginata]
MEELPGGSSPHLKHVQVQHVDLVSPGNRVWPDCGQAVVKRSLLLLINLENLPNKANEACPDFPIPRATASRSDRAGSLARNSYGVVRQTSEGQPA